MTVPTADLIKPIRDLHRRAMDVANEAFALKAHGSISRAAELFRQSFVLEADAARQIAVYETFEPSRSIMLKSAAAIALNAGAIREAEKFACLALSGTPPEDVAQELRELIEEINLQRHLDLQGIRLDTSELQVVFTGPEVASGLANSDRVFQKLKHTENLIFRTNDRLSNKPFVDGRGAHRRLRTFMSVPRTGSFAVTLRFGVPSDQMTLDIEGFDTAGAVMDEFVSCLDLYQKGHVKELQEKISEPDYYVNFVGLANHIVPDGKSFDMVGFTQMVKGDQRSVVLKPREPLDYISVPKMGSVEATPRPEPSIETITGFLKVANSRRPSSPAFEIIDSQNTPHKIFTPPGALRDIVQPYFEERVIVTARREQQKKLTAPPGRLLFISIESAPDDGD